MSSGAVQTSDSDAGEGSSSAQNKNSSAEATPSKGLSRDQSPALPSSSSLSSVARKNVRQRPEAKTKELLAKLEKERGGSKDGKDQLNMVVIGHVDAGKRCCVVSPELHGREHRAVWDLLRASDVVESDLVMICTDLPEDAREVFGHED